MGIVIIHEIKILVLTSLKAGENTVYTFIQNHFFIFNFISLVLIQSGKLVQVKTFVKLFPSTSGALVLKPKYFRFPLSLDN